MVQTQAMMNVTGTERWGVIPDEVIRFAIGRFGRPIMPVDPNVMDKIMANPRTKELAAQGGMSDLATLRRRIGAQYSDEEFLLRATMPENQIAAMQAAGPAPRDYDVRKVPVMNLLRDLLKRRDLSEIAVEKEGFKLKLEI
jgi:oxaloacetate decarboxylase (Na+ extruding) subunit alpha